MLTQVSSCKFFFWYVDHENSLQKNYKVSCICDAVIFLFNTIQFYSHNIPVVFYYYFFEFHFVF